NLLVHRMPTLLLCLVGVAGDEVGVGQAAPVLLEEVHHFFSMRSVKAGELFCRLAAAVAVPSTSRPAVSPGAALAAALSSNSVLVCPMAIVPFGAVTLAGSLRISTAIGPAYPPLRTAAIFSLAFSPGLRAKMAGSTFSSKGFATTSFTGAELAAKSLPWCLAVPATSTRNSPNGALAFTSTLTLTSL